MVQTILDLIASQACFIPFQFSIKNIMLSEIDFPRAKVKYTHYMAVKNGHCD